MPMNYTFNAELQKFPGESGWFLVRVPTKYYSELKEISRSLGAGFGAIKVQATIGKSSWSTSVFPDNEDKSFILFVKKQIRASENIELCDKVSATVKITNTTL